MFGADFDYWLRQDIDEVRENNSFDEVINRLESFRNENISGEYHQETMNSTVLDPEGEISGLGVPTVRLNLAEESKLMEAVIQDEKDLENNPNGAVMHSYSLGLGVRDAVDEIRSALSTYDEPVLEVLKGDKMNPVYEQDLDRNAVKEIKKKVKDRGTETADNMALGFLAAYATE